MHDHILWWLLCALCMAVCVVGKHGHNVSKAIGDEWDGDDNDDDQWIVAVQNEVSDDGDPSSFVAAKADWKVPPASCVEAIACAEPPKACGSPAEKPVGGGGGGDAIRSEPGLTATNAEVVTKPCESGESTKPVGGGGGGGGGT